jgi:hypothetical protein
MCRGDGPTAPAKSPSHQVNQTGTAFPPSARLVSTRLPVPIIALIGVVAAPISANLPTPAGDQKHDLHRPRLDKPRGRHRFKCIAHGDRQRRKTRSRCDLVDGERCNENGGRHQIAPPKHRGYCKAGRRPDRSCTSIYGSQLKSQKSNGEIGGADKRERRRLRHRRPSCLFHWLALLESFDLM